MHTTAALDLNLLRVLDVLLEERSATRAGARLGLSQSAVSHALGRLRHALGDDLFVRTSEGRSPTPRALEVGSGVHAALGQLQTALTPQGFDPARTERRFVMVAGAYGCAILVPKLIEAMLRLAPRSELVIAAPGREPLELLDSQRADFILSGAVRGPERVAFDRLLTENLVWLVRADNPMAAGEVTWEALASVPHVIIGKSYLRSESARGGQRGLELRASWEDLGRVDSELQARGLQFKVGLTVPDVYSAITVVRQTDMACLAPRRLAELTVQTGIMRLIEPPHTPPPFDLGLITLRERLQEPAIAWMRQLIIETAEGV